MKVTSKFKNIWLSTFWKIAYFIWVLKIVEEKSYTEIKVRILHPLWFIYIFYLLLIFWITKWFLNKEILDVKKMVVLF